MLAKKTLELNPHHSTMKTLLTKVKAAVDDKLDAETEDLAMLMYNMALINSGFNIDEPNNFTGRLQRLINSGFGLDREEPIEEIEVEVDEADEDGEEGPSSSTPKVDEDEEEIIINADEPLKTENPNVKVTEAN
jgi:hypothetical protein